jgi:transcriptional regulator with XRE-family HTH domain
MSNQRRRRELLAELKEKFGARIGTGEGKIPVHEAARILNVSRQTVHRYLNGEVMPRGDVLMAAFQAWGLVLRYRGIDVTTASAVLTPQTDTAQPVQLGLFDLVEDLKERDIEVRIARKSVESLELNVRLKFSA